MNIKEHVSKIIDLSFGIIQDVYHKQKECDGKPNGCPQSHILFPTKRDKSIRISEQELRFIFVEQLNVEIQNGWDVYYSVETPTLDTYCFSEDEPRIDPDGQSASFDLVIHDNSYNRIALIEFKANNADEKDHKKDILKLDNEKEKIQEEEKGKRTTDVESFFIEIVKGSDLSTYKSLAKKIKGFKGTFRCYSLDENREITGEILEER